MNNRHYNTEDDIEELAIITQYKEIGADTLVFHSQYFINGWVNQADKQYEGKDALWVTDVIRLATWFIDVEKVIDVDILDVYHEHYHLTCVEEQADHVMRLPEFSPFKLNQFFNGVGVEHLQVIAV